MAVPLAHWTLDSREGPVIRVGVVLPDDERSQIILEAPPTPHELLAPPDAMPGHAVCGVRVIFSAVGERVAAAIGSASVGPAITWRLRRRTDAPAPSSPAARPSPAAWSTTVLLRNARVGRGFHWEKTTDLQLPGELEVTATGGRLQLVADVPIEDYLLGVITSEMAGECPIEFLKAQCVVARSWTLAHSEHRHVGFDYCDDDCCQRFHGLAQATAAACKAVAETAGQVLLAPDGSVVDANYSKCCGGVTEDPRFVWGRGKPGLSSRADASPASPLQEMMPITEANLSEYLRGAWLDACDAYCSPNVVPPDELARFLGRVDVHGSYFRWRIAYRRAQLESTLRSKLFDRADDRAVAPLAQLQGLRVVARGESGRATELAIEYLGPTGRPCTLALSNEYEIRAALHEAFLFSSAFEIELTRRANGAIDSVVLTGAGWGHGAGLCQIGALGMALRGFDYRQILAHYFREAGLQTAGWHGQA